MPRNLRHQTFYCLDSRLDCKRDTLVKTSEAKKSVKGVYGESALYVVESNEGIKKEA
jgi:hypothetical protein